MLTARKVKNYKYTPQQARIDQEEQIARLERIQGEEIAEELMLWEWGAWSRKSGIRLWYPSRSAGFICIDDNPEGWGEKSLKRTIIDISDMVAMPIDAAVAALPPDQREAVALVYRDCVPMRSLGRAMKTSRYIAEKALNQGIGMLWGLLKKPIDTATR